LKEEFDYLTSLNDPYELLNFTEEDLIAQFEDYLEQFTDEFNIEND